MSTANFTDRFVGEYIKHNEEFVKNLEQLETNLRIFYNTPQVLLDSRQRLLKDLDAVIRFTAEGDKRFKALYESIEFFELFTRLAVTQHPTQALYIDALNRNNPLNMFGYFEQIAFDLYTDFKVNNVSLIMHSRPSVERVNRIYEIANQIEENARVLTNLTLQSIDSVEINQLGVRSEYFNKYRSYIPKTVEDVLNASKLEGLSLEQRLQSPEAAVRKGALEEKALQEARMSLPHANLKIQNGIIYDMDAINNGYPEMARVGKVPKDSYGKKEGGFFSRLFGR